MSETFLFPAPSPGKGARYLGLLFVSLSEVISEKLVQGPSSSSPRISRCIFLHLSPAQLLLGAPWSPLRPLSLQEVPCTGMGTGRGWVQVGQREKRTWKGLEPEPLAGGHARRCKDAVWPGNWEKGKAAAWPAGPRPGVGTC